MPKVGDTTLDNGLVTSEYWKKYIYIVQTHFDKNHIFCAKLCLLAKDYNCNFFVDIDKNCQLGRFVFDNDKSTGTITNETVFHFRKTYSKYQ